MRHVSTSSIARASSERGSDRQIRIGGAIWALLAIYFIAQAIAQAALTTPYSLIDNRVSDLGNTACGRGFGGAAICSPLHTVMNIGLVVTGILILLGLLLTRRAWPKRRLTTWGAVFLGVTGVGTVLVGLSPENVNVPLHLLGALNIPCGNVGLLLLGLANRRVNPWQGRLALVLSVIGVLGMLSGPVLIRLFGQGGGLSERLALYPPIVWMIMIGVAFACSRPASGRDCSAAALAAGQAV
ncbi:DUF998 domain-containing protein [Microlunatus sp. Gsoil 973]|uniref:DUF998 domain-containing protein n=1 Tax=Microlunatus sp. Gsoil 973 TaxID=2672569 RepID=UPI0012B4D1E7|nr:DUF998 domain-containing protein [Microlunatus sp. Gsoil 973]QGN32520.1 DUF998 domain-containing protein [Microlunatus sp. Gsoil 973]